MQGTQISRLENGINAVGKKIIKIHCYLLLSIGSENQQFFVEVKPFLINIGFAWSICPRFRNIAPVAADVKGKPQNIKAHSDFAKSLWSLIERDILL